MKKGLLAGLAVGVFMVGTGGMASASPIIQTDFSSGATLYDFSSASYGQTTVTSGNLTITNGIVTSNDLPGGMNTPTYYDGADSSIMRFDFGSAVSAVGMSIYANNQDITLSVYNYSDTLLEAYTIDWHTLANDGYPYGFIGINQGINSIAYALIDTPLIGNELYIDNVTYQSAAPVPEPATMLLMGTGIAGLAGFRLRRKKN